MPPWECCRRPSIASFGRPPQLTCQRPSRAERVEPSVLPGRFSCRVRQPKLEYRRVRRSVGKLGAVRILRVGDLPDGAWAGLKIDGARQLLRPMASRL